MDRKISSVKKAALFTLFSVSIIGFSWYFFTFSTYEEKEDQNYQKVFQQHYQIFALNLPNQLSFSNEPVPLHLIDVNEKLDRELHVNTYWQSNTILYIKRAHRWFQVIEPILEKNGVPNDFKYLALIESGLTQIVSPSGATGFWQIMKKTAPEYGLEVNKEVDERYHVEKATQAACAYLLEAKEKFGSWTLAAASYNMGQNGLQRQLDKQLCHSYYDLLLNEETSRYVFRILAAKHILEHVETFGFNLRSKDLYPRLEFTTIQVDSAIQNLAVFAQQQKINYKILKYYNPWLRRNVLTNPAKKTYTIKLPTEKMRLKLIADVTHYTDTSSTDSIKK